MSNPTLITLLVIALFLVGGFMFWDLRRHRIRSERCLKVWRLRMENEPESLAWAAYWAEAAARADELFAPAGAVDRVIALVEERRLEVAS